MWYVVTHNITMTATLTHVHMRPLTIPSHPIPSTALESVSMGLRSLCGGVLWLPPLLQSVCRMCVCMGGVNVDVWMWERHGTIAGINKGTT